VKSGENDQVYRTSKRGSAGSIPIKTKEGVSRNWRKTGQAFKKEKGKGANGKNQSSGLYRGKERFHGRRGVSKKKLQRDACKRNSGPPKKSFLGGQESKGINLGKAEARNLAQGSGPEKC